MDTLTSFLVGVLSSLVAVGLLKYKLIFTLLPKTTRKGYLIDLEKKIRQMPFIYKDLDTDVINDFVDVDFQSIDLGTLQLQTQSKILITQKDEKLKRNFKVLFLGNAGIGKTTFQRRTILTIINNESNSKFLYDLESPIPLYIPLKAVDNSGPYPIYRYIIENNPLFANRFGLLRLLNLAKARRVFLFLDGYDEIPFTGGTQNFVQEELNQIFSPPRLVLHSSWIPISVNTSEQSAFYEALSNCRVWLSSRREFFEKNPINCLRDEQTKQVSAIAAIELKGIGNNRIKLARKIFDKYRKRSEGYYEFLNEEYFLYEIDNSDTEIKNLSYNPLFLTVMCYIYAQKAVNEKDHKVAWAKRFDELIMECVELLLNDLDENKARDLPKAHKEALLTRRNPFIEEKKIFLQYFSIQLYFDDKPVFTIPYIKQQLREFFEVEFKSPTSDLILRNLEDDDTAKPNIALQLIYQGVFVLVDTGRDEVLYDFPHRRFREVLASKYVNTPARYERLLASAEKKQFGEFLNVFFKSESYNEPNFHDETLTLILSRAIDHISDGFFVRVTLQFIQLKPTNYNPGKIIERFLTNALILDKQFRVSLELLKTYEPNHVFIANIQTELNNSSKILNYNRFYLCAAILSFFDPLALITLLKPMVNFYLNDRLMLPIIFQYLSRLDVSNISSYVQIMAQEDEVYFDFCYAVSFNLNNDNYWTDMGNAITGDLLKQLDRRQLIIFFYFIYKYCPGKYDLLRSGARFQIKRELFEYVDHYDVETTGNSQIEDVYVLNRDTINKLNQFLKDRNTAFLLSKLFEYYEKDENGKIQKIKETRYALVLVSNEFRETLINSLNEIEFKIIEKSKFESSINKLINELTTKLIPKKSKYEKFADLSEEVRTSKVRDEVGYTRDGFQLKLQEILKQDIVHKYSDVKEASGVIKEFIYKPVQLINHFQ